MARTRSRPISPGKELSLEKVARPRRNASPRKKSVTPGPDAAGASSNVAATNADGPAATHDDDSVSFSAGPALTSVSDAVMTEPIPSIEMDEGTLQCELPGPATFSHSGSPLPVRFEEASERLAVQATPSRWTSWIVFVFSFMPAMPALSAMGHLEILQQLTNLAGRLPRINPLRSTDSPRHRRTRSRRSRSSRRKSNSPRSKMDSPSQPQVLAPQNATPIRRGQRTSYTAIANRRRTEANGTMTQTLFRVSNLVPTNEANAQNNPNPTNPDENTADIQQPAIDTTDSATEANPNALEVNRPVVDSDQPRGWSRWIFNNVSRRWTSIRDRLAPHGTEADQTTGSETETAAKAETEAEPHLVSEAKNTPTETPEKPAASVKPVSSRRPPRPPFEHLIRREPSKYHKRSHDARERLFATPYTPRRSQIPKTRDVQTTSKDCHESGSEKVIPPNSTPKPSKLVPGPSMRAQDCLTSPTQQIQEPNESRPSEPQPNASQVNASQSSTPQLNAFQAESTKDLKPMDPLEQELQKVYEAQYELIQKKRLENRRSPDTIPGPRDGGYGLDDDFYDGDSDEGALAEKQYELEQRLAKKRKIEEEVDNPNKRRKHVITSSRPPTRISRRIQTTNHSLTTNLSPITSDGSSITPKKDKEPVGPSIPATTPHVPVPNPHGTFTAPGWTSSEDEATPSTEENQAPVSHNQAPASERQATPPEQLSSSEKLSVAQTSRTAETSSSNDTPSAKDPSSITDLAAPVEDPSPVTRARNKAEIFKPKTPSRLREAHRLSSDKFEMLPNVSSEVWGSTDWLLQVCPSGELSELHWPQPRRATYSAPISVSEKVKSTEGERAISSWISLMS